MSPIATSSLWAVMMRCPDGTWSLVGRSAQELRWERNVHTITWGSEETETAAQAVAAQLNQGAARGTYAYVLPYDER